MDLCDFELYSKNERAYESWVDAVEKRANGATIRDKFVGFCVLRLLLKMCNSRSTSPTLHIILQRQINQKIADMTAYIHK